MRYTLWLLLLICIFSCEEEDRLKQTGHKLESFKDNYIPDTRTVAFDYRLEEKGDTIFIYGSTSERELILKLDSFLNGTGDHILHNEFMLLPADSLEKEWGLINLSVANIRSDAAHSSELVTQAIMGTPVRLLSRKKDWYLVQTPDQYIGWLDEEGFTSLDEKELERWKNAERLINKDFAGRSLSQPDENGAIVRDVVMGNVFVSGEEIKNGHIKIILPDGIVAWLPEKSVLPFNEITSKFINATPQDLEHYGKAMMGIPYLWGGTSAKAVDCSGFVKTIFWMNGWLMPRDASQQVMVGERVEITDSLEQLKAGDLVYFGRHTDNGEVRITHVGLHLGDRKILHASGKVKVESLNPADSLFNAYRYNSIMDARRILSNENEYALQTVRGHTWYY